MAPEEPGSKQCPTCGSSDVRWAVIEGVSMGGRFPRGDPGFQYCSWGSFHKQANAEMSKIKTLTVDSEYLC